MKKYDIIVKPYEGMEHYEIIKPFCISEDDIYARDKYSYWKRKAGNPAFKAELAENVKGRVHSHGYGQEAASKVKRAPSFSLRSYLLPLRLFYAKLNRSDDYLK